MDEQSASCTRTTASVGTDSPPKTDESIQIEKKETAMTARVGQKAPDFTTMAYYQGNFKPITLSDYLGKWVMLCFYPGDFTFV